MILQNKSFLYILIIYFVLVTLYTISPSKSLATDENRTACFNKLFSDFGTDTNMNELYEYITIKVGISAFAPGEYEVRGSLHDVSGNEVNNSTHKAFLKPGIRFITLEFYGLSSPGQFNLKNLCLYDKNGSLIDYIGDAYTTRNKYYSLENGPLKKAKLAGNYSDYGIDINKDGLYDYLAIDAGIDVNMPGEYSLMGYLNYSKNRDVNWAIDHRNFSKGRHNMHLLFDGKSLNKRRMNGSYYLEKVSLIFGSSYSGLDMCDYLLRAYNTSVFNYSDFAE
jgi:hypothetical protein